jgi:ribonuclease P/MRP protein subunit POP5
MKTRLKSTPTLRQKKRYVFFRVHTDGDWQPDFLNIRGAIWNSLESWLGESGVAKAGIKIIVNLWNQKSLTGVLVCTPKSVDQIRLALGLVHQIGDQRAVVQVLRVSGTIKAGKDKLGI